MRIAYFDCFSGAAGDMILASMIAAGLPADELRAQLGRLNLAGYELDIRNIRKQGFAAVKFDVRMTDKPGHRHLHHIIQIIDDSSLSPTIKDRARRIFTRLAEAEAKVHGTTIEKVHFHEVGAIDAIVDIVGASIGMELLGIERVVCSPLPTGGGTVRCEHGLMPVPAPATAELLIGVPLAPCEETGELLTPTGAAVLTTLADSFGPIPRMEIARIGYGAGTREGRTRPNILRLLVGEAVACSGLVDDEIVALEANIDDASGQQIGHAFASLLSAGALDVFTVPIQMKKNRPGVLLSVLVTPDRIAACEEILFTQTPTFGVRRYACSRRKLDRRMETVSTRFGDVRVKLGLRGGLVCVVAPEYDDCAAAAAAHRVSLKDVFFEAESAWRAKHHS